MRKKIFLSTLALATLALAGCGDGGTNTTNTANRANTNATTNLGTNNASNAYVVNSNATNTVSTTNRWSNANITRDEYDKNRADYERDKRAGETIGTGANDGWLWTKTRAALLTTSDLRESTIDVDVENEVVTLDGTVGTAAQKTRAEQVAKGIEGVKSVRNNLKVAPNDSMANMGGNSNAARSSNANANR